MNSEEFWSNLQLRLNSSLTEKNTVGKSLVWWGGNKNDQNSQSSPSVGVGSGSGGAKIGLCAAISGVAHWH